MPRKKESQAAPAPAAAAAPAVQQVLVPIVQQPPQAQQISIDRDNFVKVRDSVYARLSTIQDLIKSFSVDYVRQTNLLLGEPTTLTDELDAATAGFGLMPLVHPLIAQAAPGEEEKKQRKKRSVDPDHPKRPLTPYFLYMGTARPIIANDLGADAAKGAVQEEGQRRWSVMTPEEKRGWNQAYKYNLRLYNARVQSYKAGNKDAKNMTDEEASAYADAHDIPMGQAEGGGDLAVATDEHETNAERLQHPVAADEPEEEVVVEPTKTPVAKTSRPRQPRKRPLTAAAPEEADEAKPSPSAPASSEKKRKRSSKAVEVDAAEPKKSSRKKSKA